MMTLSQKAQRPGGNPGEVAKLELTPPKHISYLSRNESAIFHPGERRPTKVALNTLKKAKNDVSGADDSPLRIPTPRIEVIPRPDTPFYDHPSEVVSMTTPLCPKNCPRFSSCSAPICPLDKDWSKRTYHRGEAICRLMLEIVKPDGIAVVADALSQEMPKKAAEAIAEEIAKTGAIIAHTNAAIDRYLKRAADSPSKIHSGRKLKKKAHGDDL